MLFFYDRICTLFSLPLHCDDPPLLEEKSSDNFPVPDIPYSLSQIPFRPFEHARKSAPKKDMLFCISFSFVAFSTILFLRIICRFGIVCSGITH